MLLFLGPGVISPGRCSNYKTLVRFKLKKCKYSLEANLLATRKPPLSDQEKNMRILTEQCFKDPTGHDLVVHYTVPSKILNCHLVAEKPDFFIISSRLWTLLPSFLLFLLAFLQGLRNFDINRSQDFNHKAQLQVIQEEEQIISQIILGSYLRE